MLNLCHVKPGPSLYGWASVFFGAFLCSFRIIGELTGESMVFSQRSFTEKLAGGSSMLCTAFPDGPAAGPPRQSHASLRSDQHRHRSLPGLPAGRGGALPGGGAGQPRSGFTTRRQPSGPELLPMVSHLVVSLKELCSYTHKGGNLSL